MSLCRDATCLNVSVPFANHDTVELCYEEAGNPDGPVILLIPGLGMQLIDWPDYFVDALGIEHRLLLLDNRDRGLSTTLHGAPSDGAAVMDALLNGREPELAYTLSDMAADAVAVLDTAEVDQAHIVGISMGGMIAQTMAIEHPDRVQSLTSVMSTTGAPDVGQPTEAALTAILSAPPEDTRQSAIDHGVVAMRAWASPDYYDPGQMATNIARSWDRVGGAQAEGTARQVCAIVAAHSRDDQLRSLDTPALVIHGTADALIQPSGGERTASCIPGAELLLIERMGHDIPEQCTDQLVTAISKVVSNA